MNAAILATALFLQTPGYPQTITVNYQGQPVTMTKILDSTDGVGHHAEQSWTDDAGTIHHSPIVRYRADWGGSYLFWERTELPVESNNPQTVERFVGNGFPVEPATPRVRAPRVPRQTTPPAFFPYASQAEWEQANGMPYPYPMESANRDDDHLESRLIR